jgi:hypothetical protein
MEVGMSEESAFPAESIGMDTRLTPPIGAGSMTLSTREVVMRQDMELIRKILQHVEARTDLDAREVEIDGVDEIFLGRHVERLFDLGYLEGSVIKTNSRPYKRVLVTDLSFDGHEFCAALSSNGVLEKIKDAFDAKELAALPLKAIKETAVALSIAYAKSKLGMV